MLAHATVCPSATEGCRPLDGIYYLPPRRPLSRTRRLWYRIRYAHT
jgi:hypothetical protein